jgi:hypothetical protein
MSDRGDVLAKDIQQNVGTLLFTDSTNAQALNALRLDAQELNVGAKHADGTFDRGTNQAFQESVQKALLKLETDGHLPTVTISDNGEIEASAKVSPTSATTAADKQPAQVVERDVLADPSNPTSVSDLRLTAKIWKSLDQLIDESHPETIVQH